MHLGDFVRVQGKVSEFAGTTEIGASAADVSVLTDSHDPVTPAAIAYPTTDAAREAHEGELLAPTNDLTVTDNFDLNAFGEIGLATGDHQLVQPTDVANPTSDPAGVAAVQADNAARVRSRSTTGRASASSTTPTRAFRCRGSPRTTRSGSAPRPRCTSR